MNDPRIIAYSEWLVEQSTAVVEEIEVIANKRDVSRRDLDRAAELKGRQRMILDALKKFSSLLLEEEAQEKQNKLN